MSRSRGGRTVLLNGPTQQIEAQDLRGARGGISGEEGEGRPALLGITHEHPPQGQPSAAWPPFLPPACGAVIGCTERGRNAVSPYDHPDQGGDRATTWASFLI